MALIIAGIAGVVGIILGSKLSSINELRNYRREKLEQLALSVGDYINISKKQHTRMLDILSKETKSKQIVEDSINTFEEQSNKVNYFKTMSSLHATELIEHATQYLNKINKYDNEADNLLEDRRLSNLKLAPSKNQPIDTTEIHKLFEDSMVAGHNFIFEISDEIYKKSWLEKLNIL